MKVLMKESKYGAMRRGKTTTKFGRRVSGSPPSNVVRVRGRSR